MSLSAMQSKPRLTENSLEQQLLRDADDGQWDQFSLVEAALVAGGTKDRQRLTKLSDQFNLLVQQLEAEIPPGCSMRQKAIWAFHFLHRQVLTGPYQSDLYKLEETLSQGTYNCLTATILYQAFCQHLQIPTTAISTPGHVRCLLFLKQPIKVETTYSTWFDVGDVSLHSNNSISTINNNSISSSFAIEREITPVQLVAKVYYNRAALHLHQKQFLQAMVALKICLVWDGGDRSARENRLACLNNWALFLSDHDRYAKAVALLQQGEKIDPHDARFAENLWHVTYRWAIDLCRHGQYEKALQISRRCRHADTDQLKELQKVIFSQWLRK